MTSLIKRKGGYKRFKKAVYSYDNISKKTISKFSRFLDDEKQKKLQELLNKLNDAVYKAYAECEKNKITKTTSALSTPLCVAIAAVQNGLKSTQFVTLEKEIQELIEKYEKNGDKPLNEYLSYDSLELPVKTFKWVNCPEGYAFWKLVAKAKRDFYCSKKWSENNPYFTDIEMYKDFIDAHPECETEIENFCSK